MFDDHEGNYISLLEYDFKEAFELLVQDAYDHGYNLDKVHWTIEDDFLIYRTEKLMDEILEFELQNLRL